MSPSLRRLAFAGCVALAAAIPLARPQAVFAQATAPKPALPAVAPQPRMAPLPASPVVVQPLTKSSPGIPIGTQPPAAVLSLEINKSQIIHLGKAARDVIVANPAVADVVLRSATTVFVVGRKVGETNVYFIDAEGRQVDRIDVMVTFDSAAVSAALKRMIPNEQIEVSSANQSLVLMGSVASPQVSENARQIARQFVADDNSIINLLNIRDKTQVLIRVRVSEMSRQIAKDLGISLSSNSFNLLGTRIAQISTPLGAVTSPFGSVTAILPRVAGSGPQFTAILSALESNGLIKTLAEPNLTAVSGETASFLVGGQFPVPSPQAGSAGAAATITVTYKDFGVRLTFTPVVLSGGMINLRIATEVSALSTQGQVIVTGFTIPALSVRRAETTVELPSGGSIAIAGLLQNDITNTIEGLPFLKDVPVLGALFRSTAFQRRETDLVISVTPLLVRAADPNALVYPTDGFGPASDFNLYLLGLLHATYAKPTAAPPKEQPKSPYGFILE